MCFTHCDSVPPLPPLSSSFVDIFTHMTFSLYYYPMASRNRSPRLGFKSCALTTILISWPKKWRQTAFQERSS